MIFIIWVGSIVRNRGRKKLVWVYRVVFIEECSWLFIEEGVISRSMMENVGLSGVLEGMKLWSRYWDVGYF